ncbi:MAG: Rha family transcriptional regulator, partial [Gammaproteobacteria bacterium]
MFEIDRQGFEILAMGFTGAKALEWKFRYSDAFAAMEAEITNRQTLRIPTTITEAL